MKVTGQRQERGISNAIFHLWKTKCGGMKPCLHKELKDIQEENSRLKCMNTNRSMMYDTLKRVTEKPWDVWRSTKYQFALSHRSKMRGDLFA